MAKTFTNEPINMANNHKCKTERGTYMMGPSWIDTTAPSDMTDYDFTMSISDCKQASIETHQLWCQQQIRA